jgi:hypothetical protein
MPQNTLDDGFDVNISQDTVDSSHGVNGRHVTLGGHNYPKISQQILDSGHDINTPQTTRPLTHTTTSTTGVPTSLASCWRH